MQRGLCLLLELAPPVLPQGHYNYIHMFERPTLTDFFLTQALAETTALLCGYDLVMLFTLRCNEARPLHVSLTYAWPPAWLELKLVFACAP